MKHFRLFSRTSHFFIICCFCLPFLKGCDGCNTIPADEKAAMEKAQQDSIAAFVTANIPDTAAVVLDSNSTPVTTEQPNDTYADSLVQAAITKKQTLSEKFMSEVLMPNGDFSGIALVVVGFYGGIAIAVTLCFILIVISLFISFSKKSMHKILLIFSCIEIFLLSSFLVCCYKEILYGFWVVFTLCCLNAVACFVQMKKIKFTQRSGDTEKHGEN